MKAAEPWWSWAATMVWLRTAMFSSLVDSAGELPELAHEVGLARSAW
jgi:hypothetical protein